MKRGGARTCLCALGALFALLVLLIVNPSASRAQGPPPLPGDIPGAYESEVTFYAATQNALQAVQEWGGPGRHFLIQNQFSTLERSLQDLAPRLYFRDRGLAVLAGTQYLRGATPFHDSLSYQGAWAGGASRRWSWSAWGGKTQNLDQYLLTGVFDSQAFLGATMGYRPTSYTSWGASVMRYASQPGGSPDRTLGMATGYVTDRRTWSLLGAYGIDAGGGIGAGSLDRRAWRLVGSYGRKRLNLSLDAMAIGRFFGPNQGVTDLRGQQWVNATAQYQLSPELVFTEYYRSYENAVPVVYGPRSRNMLWQHYLTWNGTDGMRLFGGYQQTWQSSGVPGLQGLQGGSLFFEGNGYLGSLALGGDVRSEDLGQGVRDLQLRLRLGIPLTDELALTLQEAYVTSSAPSVAASRSFQTTLGLTARSLDDRLLLGLQNQLTRSQAGAASQSTNNASANLLYRVVGPFWVGGGITMASGGGNQSSAGSARARWVLDRHSELVFQHFFNSTGQSFVLDGQPQVLKGTYSLSLRNSFGGPSEARFDAARQGTIAVQLAARPAGSGGGKPLGLGGLSLQVGERTVRTDASGRAILRQVEPGTYTVEIPADTLGTNYELEGPARRTVQVRPAETTRVQFRATAFTSILALTWNDVEGTGKVGEFFTPFSGLRVRVEGVGEQATDASGSARFGRLAPGRYRVSLDPASVKPGLVSTTPVEREVELRPGQEVVLAFGFQGFGALAGRVLEIPTGGRHATQTVEGASLLLDGRSLGETGRDGRFEFRVPAGTHELRLGPETLGATRYEVPGPLRVDVGVKESVSRELVMASFGEIRGRIMRRTPQGLVPLAVSGVIVNFSGEPSYVYTDENGAFRFERLRMGSYRVELDAASLPSERRLEGPNLRDIDLSSGEQRQVEFVVR